MTFARSLKKSSGWSARVFNDAWIARAKIRNLQQVINRRMGNRDNGPSKAGSRKKASKVSSLKEAVSLSRDSRTNLPQRAVSPRAGSRDNPAREKARVEISLLSRCKKCWR